MNQIVLGTIHEGRIKIVVYDGAFPVKWTEPETRSWEPRWCVFDDGVFVEHTLGDEEIDLLNQLVIPVSRPKSGLLDDNGFYLAVIMYDYVLGDSEHLEEVSPATSKHIVNGVMEALKWEAA